MILHWVHVLTSSVIQFFFFFFFFIKSIISVVMETKVSTLVKWVLGKSKEDIRLNFVLVSTKLIWTLVNMIAKHFYKHPHKQYFFSPDRISPKLVCFNHCELRHFRMYTFL